MCSMADLGPDSVFNFTANAGSLRKWSVICKKQMLRKEDFSKEVEIFIRSYFSTGNRFPKGLSTTC